MLILENFLNDRHLAYLRSDLDRCRLNSALWRPNRGFWPDRLIKDFDGRVEIATAGYNVSKMLRTLINQHVNLRNYNYFGVQYTLWHKNSGLAKHRDPHWGLAATLYLNESWFSEWGGLLTWEDHAYVPKFNSIVINDKNKEHWVTKVSTDETRITAQCWAK